MRGGHYGAKPVQSKPNKTSVPTTPPWLHSLQAHDPMESCNRLPHQPAACRPDQAPALMLLPTHTSQLLQSSQLTPVSATSSPRKFGEVQRGRHQAGLPALQHGR